MRAIDAVKAPAHTVPVGTSLADVARLLATEGIRAVVVTGRDDEPVGIVTERDLVVRGLAFDLPTDTTVDAVMTPDVVTADPAAPTRSVFRLLGDHHIRQVPLVEAGRVVGVVGRDDLSDETTAEVLAGLAPCPYCGRRWFQPVATTDSTNFLCLWCRSCWHLRDAAFVRVEPRSCLGCPEHNFCRFPLIDYGLRPAAVRASAAFLEDC